MINAAMLAPMIMVVGSADGEWVSFDGSPPGRVPSVVWNADDSTENKTVADITVHGIWLMQVEDVGGQSGIWTAARIPGHPVHPTIGWPAVPRLGVQLAMRGDAQEGTILAFDVLDQVQLAGIRLAPTQPDIEDSPETINDPQPAFVIDDAFYQQMDEPWPPGPGMPAAPALRMHHVEFQPMALNAAVWNPATEVLTVRRTMRVVFEQPDNMYEPVTLSRRSLALLADMSFNIAELLDMQLLFKNNDGCDGNYLIVCREEYRDELQPLVQQKLERGFKVAFRYVSASDMDPFDIRSDISDWWQTLATTADAYCLLVGDIDHVPLHPDVVFGTVREMDYWYGCVDNILYAAVGVGRLSVDSATDLETQLEKIIDYQSGASSDADWYRKIHQTVHWNTDHGFQGKADWLETLPFTGAAPIFSRRTGVGSSGDDINDLVADIDAGHHMLIYHGHGTDQRWAEWTANQDSLWRSDVQACDNDAPSIVFSTGCQTSSVQQLDDCISEIWMETSQRAVAHVGPTRNYWRAPAGTLGGYFFLEARAGGALSDCLRNAQVSALIHHHWSEDSLKNHYQTILLGDPDMRVLDKRPLYMSMSDHPWFIEPGLANYSMIVHDYTGAPIEGAAVALTMNEVLLGTAYADAMGQVHVPLVWPGQLGDLPEGSSVRVRVWHDMQAVVDSLLDIPVGEACSGDVTQDGVVNISDLLHVIDGWSNPYAIEDLLIVLDDWGCGADGL